MPGGAGGYSGPYGFVVGRSERAGDFKDVRIRTTPEGFNYVELARDARDTSRRRYVVDRLIKPDGTADDNSGTPENTAGGNVSDLPSTGAWTRVVEVESFSKDASPERMTETRCEVVHAPVGNSWGIEAERCFGLPSGMESPWQTPLEMVANELLVPLTDDEREPGETNTASPKASPYTVFVSGDAPVNTSVSVNAGAGASASASGTNSGRVVSNGAYTVVVGARAGVVEVYREGRLLGALRIPDNAAGGFAGASGRASGTDNAQSVEGTAGVVYYDGGEVFVEPAKPPMLFGSYVLPFDVRYARDGLYEAVGIPGLFVITSEPVEGRRASGMVALVSDPYPERWVPRLMGRAYTSLTSPALVPPFVEEDPKRISVYAVRVEDEYPDIEGIAVTPYANKTGVFNSWEADGDTVVFRPSRRPFDALFTFDTGRVRDIGANPSVPEGATPALDSGGQVGAQRIGGVLGAMFRPEGGYTPDIEADYPEGVLFFRFSDSTEFEVIRTAGFTAYYREGYLYLDRREPGGGSGGGDQGLARVPAPDASEPGSFKSVRIEWGPSLLRVNGVDADTTKNLWSDVLFVGDTDETRTWAEVSGIPVPEGDAESLRNPDLPLNIEDYLDAPPLWETGRAVVDAADAGGDELAGQERVEARTWGRVLFEGFETTLSVGDARMSVGEAGSLRMDNL